MLNKQEEPIVKRLGEIVDDLEADYKHSYPKMRIVIIATIEESDTPSVMLATNTRVDTLRGMLFRIAVTTPTETGILGNDLVNTGGTNEHTTVN